jgi:pilus assembly protein FimV
VLSAALLLVIASAANAAGLGKLVVLSAMGEPFRAEIDLLSGPDELSALTPRLASPDLYRPADFRYNPALTGTRLDIRTRADGRQVIEVVSQRPLNEPFVYLLVELESNTTRMVRGYTALLDPQGYRAPQSIARTAYLPAPVTAAVPTVKVPPVKPATLRAPATEAVRAVAPPAPRQERWSDADAISLAAMLERVAALEAAVTQLQRQWEKPAAVAAVQGASAAPPARIPAATGAAPVTAPSPPVVQQKPAPSVEPVPRRTVNQDSLLNNALLVLVIGLLILLGGLVYVMWGRPAVQERLARGKG